jgi:hypothetical protein
VVLRNARAAALRQHSAAVANAILSAAGVPGSSAGLPPELLHILDRPEKNRELRYQSAADLRADLKRLACDSEWRRPVSAVLGGRIAVLR